MQALTSALRQNEMFITFMGSLVTLSVCMLAGYIGRKAAVLTDDVNAAMTTLLVKITLPCTVFMSLMRPFSKTLLAESLATFVISSVVYLSGYAIGAFLARLFKVPPDQRRIWQFALVFANVGYMGFPVTLAVFGESALIYASMANASFNIMAFSFGVKMFMPAQSETDPAAPKPSRWAALKPALFNPALLATYIGMFFFVFSLRLPDTVQQGVNLLGGMTTPVSMLLVGSILAKSKLRELFSDIKILPVIGLRLLGIPLTAFFILRPFLHNHVMLGVIVALSAMPVASLTVIFAEQYRGNTALASRLVALSTVCCIVSIPLISMVLG